MASLSSVLATRVTATEDNLERGTVYVFGTGNQNNCICFCWKPPSSGTAIIEAWGAGGSGARQCCCGFGIGGHSGAYSKKTITVTASCFVCGTVGLSCGNASALCFRGCSDATCICWTGSGSSGCICAQGGHGGYSYCSTSTSLYCCFVSFGYCNTLTAGNSGIICNIYSGAFRGCGYGGDVNCCSNFSCIVACNTGDANETCVYIQSLAVPPGMATVCGANLIFGVDRTNIAHSSQSGAGIPEYLQGLVSYGRSPSASSPMYGCWASSISCGCYEANGCAAFAPPAHPGTGMIAGDPSVRDHGMRGGNGLVKITFYT